MKASERTITTFVMHAQLLSSLLYRDSLHSTISFNNYSMRPYFVIFANPNSFYKPDILALKTVLINSLSFVSLISWRTEGYRSQCFHGRFPVLSVECFERQLFDRIRVDAVRHYTWKIRKLTYSGHLCTQREWSDQSNISRVTAVDRYLTRHALSKKSITRNGRYIPQHNSLSALHVETKVNNVIPAARTGCGNFE